MNTNNNISIWRGSNTPPTKFHLWLKNNKLYHFDGIDWIENKVETASYENDGLMSKEDKERLDNLVYDGLDSIDIDKALSANLGNILLNKINDLKISAYKAKGSVENFDNLPTENLEIGDVYNILNSFYINNKKYPEGTNVVWTGSKWDPLGGTVDFSDYSTIEQVEVLYSELNSKLSEYQNNTNQLIEEKSLEATAALAAEVARASEQESNLSMSISDLNLSLTTESSRATAAEETLRTSKVDKVEGKSLVSDDQIVKLTNLDNQDDITSNIADAKKAGTDALSSLNSHISNVSNPHEVTKDLIGLGNVNNTSDLSKPISIATQEALNGKVDKIVGKGLSTEDFTRAYKTVLDNLHINYAPLIDGLVPAANLPSYVDDIIESESKNKFPTTGESGKIYVALDTNLTYRWGGTEYVEISKSLALGETANTAYAGDKGAANATAIVTHTGNTNNPHGVTKSQVGLGNVDNTSDLNKPVSTATQIELNKKVDKIEGKGLSTEDYTTADKTKLASIANGAQVNSITGVKGGAEESYRTGNVNITAANLGLGNVNDTSDADKPISTATQTALNNKVDKVTGKGLSSEDYTSAEKTKLSGIEAGAQVNTITGIKGSSESSYRTGNVSISPSNIGLGNVDNTNDLSKPISTAQLAALDEKVDKVAGKDLSTNDYTTDEKNKLAGIAARAQVNVIESVKVNGTTQAISNKEIDIPIPTKLSLLTNDIYEVATSVEITAILN